MQSQESKSAATAAVKQVYKSGRRPRVPLSCDPCRSRKLKCNREHPCQNCIVRSEECKYRGSKHALGSLVLPLPGHERDETMQRRIDRLESLVQTLTSQGQTSSNIQDSTLPNMVGGTGKPPEFERPVAEERLPLPYNAGTTVINRGHSVYTAGNDWADVLQEVKQLKIAWNQSQDDPPDYEIQRSLFQNIVAGSSFLSDQLKNVEISELLAALPVKSEVDELVYQYFDRRSLAMPIAPVLHKPTFMREYEKHWKNPTETNIMWLGLLFSILGIIMLSYHQFENEPPEYVGRAEALFEQYRLRTAQCLMIGDIAKCLPYTLETLLLNSTAELARKDDNARGLWMMTGLMIRSAISMGYHRDPSHTPSISVLRGELRRRVWLALVHKDDLAAFLVGFPSMMHAIYSDTLEPRNLHDWELSDETKVLPPSRPLEESTPVTYLIAKGRLMRALGRVTDLNNSLRPGTYDKVVEIDSSLYKAFENLPALMRLHDVSTDSNCDQNQIATTVSILQMEFLYHLGMCTLHRKFLSRGRLDPEFSLSRDRCISSALALLAQQHIFHHEAPMNRLFMMPDWFKVPQAVHNFTLAAMILCLDLEHRRRGAKVDMAPAFSVIFQALERSCAIWKDVQVSSDEARRVHHVLKGMLSSFEPAASTSSSQTQASEPPVELLELDQQAQNDGGTLSFDQDAFETSIEMDIDWATWDSFIEGTSFEDAYEEILINHNDVSCPTE